MVQPLEKHRETASQTGGPYVHIGCIPTFAGLDSPYAEDLGKRAIEDGAAGQTITITGQIFDGTGWAIRDAMFESWQPDAEGRFPGQKGADPKVNGFCRFAADGETGEFTLHTVKPGSVAGQAPHVSLWIVGRGINIGLQTRIYFEDEDNSSDPVLSRIEQKNRVETLVAKKTAEGAYRFDIRLQGDAETVFLDI